MEAVEDHVVPGVHDSDDLVRRDDADEPAQQAGGPDTSGESSDHGGQANGKGVRPSSQMGSCRLWKAPAVPSPIPEPEPPNRPLPLALAVEATALLGTRTGVGRFVEGALQALAAQPGLAVRAFAISWRRRRWLVDGVPRGVEVRQRAMPARPLHAAWSHQHLPPVEWFIGACDVVHGTNFVVPPTRRAARIVTVHDLTPLRFPQLCDQATLGFPALVRRAVQEGAWVHTPTNAVAAEVVEAFGAPPERVRAVAHGVPAYRAQHGGLSEGDPLEDLLPRGCRRIVLAVGTVEPRKDFPCLVEAFGLVASTRTDVALVIAGRDGWGAEALARAVERSPWRRRIVRPGYLSPPRLAELWQSATVLAYPSVYEGFGFPPLEAMQAGVPVVASAVEAVSEVVGEAAVLVPPGDADALAGALALVLDDEHQQAELRAAGRARVAQYSWEACASGLGALYRDAVAAR